MSLLFAILSLASATCEITENVIFVGNNLPMEPKWGARSIHDCIQHCQGLIVHGQECAYTHYDPFERDGNGKCNFLSEKRAANPSRSGHVSAHCPKEPLMPPDYVQDRFKYPIRHDAPQAAGPLPSSNGHTNSAHSHAPPAPLPGAGTSGTNALLDLISTSIQMGRGAHQDNQHNEFQRAPYASQPHQPQYGSQWPGHGGGPPAGYPSHGGRTQYAPPHGVPTHGGYDPQYAPSHGLPTHGGYDPQYAPSHGLPSRGGYDPHYAPSHGVPSRGGYPPHHGGYDSHYTAGYEQGGYPSQPSQYDPPQQAHGWSNWAGEGANGGFMSRPQGGYAPQHTQHSPQHAPQHTQHSPQHAPQHTQHAPQHTQHPPQHTQHPPQHAPPRDPYAPVGSGSGHSPQSSPPVSPWGDDVWSLGGHEHSVGDAHHDHNHSH